MRTTRRGFIQAVVTSAVAAVVVRPGFIRLVHDPIGVLSVNNRPWMFYEAGSLKRFAMATAGASGWYRGDIVHSAIAPHQPIGVAVQDAAPYKHAVLQTHGVAMVRFVLPK